MDGWVGLGLLAWPGGTAGRRGLPADGPRAAARRRLGLHRRRQRSRADPGRQPARVRPTSSCGRGCWSTCRAVDTGTTLLGDALAAPVGVAPTAYHRLVAPRRRGRHGPGRRRGRRAVRGDASSPAAPLEDIAAAATGPLWLQLYWLRRRDVMAVADRPGRGGRLPRAGAHRRRPGASAGGCATCATASRSTRTCARSTSTPS